MFGFIKQAMKNAAERKATQETERNELIQKHIPTLFRRSKQILLRDDYGIISGKAWSKWSKEKDHFCLRVLNVRLRTNEAYAITGHKWGQKNGIIDDMIELYEKSNSIDASAISGPADYEVKCAHFLEKAGWSTTLTKSVGDQGADIIAQKDTRKMVVQCKYYAKPVGNKAVQEVVAAKDFFGAELALVVASNGFTKAAMELASANRVFLRHHIELTQFNENASTDAAW